MGISFSRQRAIAVASMTVKFFGQHIGIGEIIEYFSASEYFRGSLS